MLARKDGFLYCLVAFVRSLGMFNNSGDLRDELFRSQTKSNTD